MWFSYKQAITQLQEGSVPQIVYAFGQEPLIKQQLLDVYQKSVLTSEMGDLNYSAFEGRELDWPSLAAALMTRPYFAPRRLVTIASAEVLIGSSEKRKLLESAFADLPVYTCVMLQTANRPNSRLRLIKIITERGWVVDCASPSKRELVQLIISEAEKEGKQISQKAAYEIVELIGGSYPEVRANLEKLLLYCSDEESITLEAIRLVVQPSLQANVFNYVDALGTRNLQRAWQALDLMLKSNEPPLRIMAMVARQLRLLLSAKLILQQSIRSNLAQELGVPGFVADKLVQQARNFTVDELKHLMLDLCDLEASIKTGQIDAQHGLFMFTVAVSKL